MPKWITTKKDPMLAVAVIRGLCDDACRYEVSFAIQGSFAEVIDLIDAAYRSVGDSDLQSRERTVLVSLTSPRAMLCLPRPP